MAVFNVPKAAGDKKENRFAFRAKDGGKVYSVPFMQYVSGAGAEFMEDAVEQKLDEVRMTRGLLSIECPQAKDAIRGMAMDQIVSLSRAWAAASTASLGESLGSDES